MHHFSSLILAIFVGLGLAGCNTLAGQPSFKEAGVEPPALVVGQSAIISATIKDKHRTVVKVEGTVKEDPRLKFRLRDDGQDPDLKAGDGIYTLRVDVQPQVPPGQFTLELTAYNSNGVPVLVKPKGGDAAPLTQIIPVSIATAPQQ